MCGTRGRLAAMLAVFVVATACAGCRPILPPPPPSTPAVLDAACKGTLVAWTTGTVASNSVTELSGIVASQRVDGVWWGHNDSGDTARIFAIGDDGRDLGSYAFSGITATDWEDIAAGPGPNASTQYLYIADIGDNLRTRPSIRVYRVPEPLVDPNAPTPPLQTLAGVDTLTFTYPDRPQNAESLLVDPISGELVIVTKEFSGPSTVFRAPANLASGSSTVLTKVATITLGTGLAGQATGADVTPDGDVVALRSYAKILLFPRPAGTTLGSAFTRTSCAGKTASEAQGEAIGFTRNGRDYVTASEGAHPALHRFAPP